MEALDFSRHHDIRIRALYDHQAYDKLFELYRDIGIMQMLANYFAHGATIEDIGYLEGTQSAQWVTIKTAPSAPRAIRIYATGRINIV